MKKIIISLSILVSIMTTHKLFADAATDACARTCLNPLIWQIINYGTVGGGSGFGYINSESMYMGEDDKQLPLFLYLGAGSAPARQLRFEFYYNYFSQSGSKELDDGSTVTSTYNISSFGIAFTFVPFGNGLFFKAGAGISSFTSRGDDDSWDGKITDDDTYKPSEYTGFSFILETGVLLVAGEVFQISFNVQYAHQSYYNEPDSEDGPKNSNYIMFFVTASVGDFSFRH